MVGCFYVIAAMALTPSAQNLSSQLSLLVASNMGQNGYISGFEMALLLLPYVLFCGLCFALILLLLCRSYYKKQSIQSCIYTLSPRHFTPTVFEVLGAHWQQLAFRTGQEFVVINFRIKNVEVSKNIHAEFGFCLGSCLREDDVIGDYALGEFYVLLPCISEALDYHIVLHRLRIKLLKTSICVNNVERSVTLFPEGGSSFSQLLLACEQNHNPL